MKKHLATISIILSMALPQLARADITSNLIAWYKLDEGSGTTALDSSGNGYNGSLIGGVTYAPGIVGPYSVQTNGTTSSSAYYVSIPDQTALNLQSTNFTISLWINPVVAGWPGGFYTALVSKRVDGGTMAVTYELYLSPSSASGVLGYYAGASLENTSYTPPTNAWTMVTFVNLGSNNGEFYVNGSPIQSITGSTPGAATVGATLKIGYDAPSAPSDVQQFDGQIDDVRIYARALSAGDVAQLYLYRGLSYQTLTVYLGSVLRIFKGAVLTVS